MTTHKPGYLLQATRKQACQNNWKWRFYIENKPYIQRYAVNCWVEDFFIEEATTMERVGQFVEIEVYGKKRDEELYTLYRPLDKGKSKEVWHVTATRDFSYVEGIKYYEPWKAVQGWRYSPYEKPRNKRDRRQMLLFDDQAAD